MEKIAKIVITGYQGFIGKNLFVRLKSMGFSHVVGIGKDTSDVQLEDAVKDSRWIIHLAGVNRPKDVEEFKKGNADFTVKLLALVEKTQSKASIIASSTIQAEANHPYGLSKKSAEDALIDLHKKHGNPVFIYRLVNVFGKWSRPNYNSVVATFCHNVSRKIPLTIHDSQANIRLVYIDDVVDEFLRCMEGSVSTVDQLLRVLPEYELTVGDLAQRLNGFEANRFSLKLEQQTDPLTKKLYATYLSFLDEHNFTYPLTMHKDQRGSFTEILKTSSEGQISVNISKPGITKGNHYHHTKNEKFIVVSGKASIKFRQVDSSEVIEKIVSGERIEVVDIPPGYAHSITNLLDADLVTIMWASEVFDPNNPDTYPMEVVIK